MTNNEVKAAEVLLSSTTRGTYCDKPSNKAVTQQLAIIMETPNNIRQQHEELRRKRDLMEAGLKVINDKLTPSFRGISEMEWYLLRRTIEVLGSELAWSWQEDKSQE